MINITPKMVSFFKYGFFIHDLTIEEQNKVSILRASLKKTFLEWIYDHDETDVLMPSWSVFFQEHPQRDLVLRTYQPIIEQYSWLYDHASEITETSIHAGIHMPSTEWHTDYADSHRADAFILAYPNDVPLRSGNLSLGERQIDEGVNLLHCISPVPNKIVFVNNMSPFFVHRVGQMNNENEQDRILCLVGWRRNAKRTSEKRY